MEQVIGVVFPQSKETIDFMFSNKRTIYVKYLSGKLKNKSRLRLKEGSKLYLYESGGKRSVVGEAIINKIELLDMNSILDKYSNKLTVSDEVFKIYAEGREDKEALVLGLQPLIKYTSVVKLTKPLTMTGIYVTAENEDQLFVGN